MIFVEQKMLFFNERLQLHIFTEPICIQLL